MEHHFDVEIAKEYGLNEAILLNNIFYWIEKNRANEKHFYDGYYWTYSSAKAFSELFPYMKERSILRYLNNLIEAGILIKDNYNKVGYDRTTWYAITEKGYAAIYHRPMEKAIEPEEVKEEPEEKADSRAQEQKEIIAYLNEKTGSSYRTNSKETVKHINARLAEGYTVNDFKTVIDKKTNSWGNDEKMCKFLRPATLFGTKFESYLNEKVKPKGNSCDNPHQFDYAVDDFSKL